MLSAHDFAEEMPGTPRRRGYRFGVKATAVALRALADRIDSGEVNVRDVKVESDASQQDFVTTTLHLKLIERAPDGEG